MIPRLFLVTDRTLADDLPRVVERVTSSVRCAVLLREKDLPARELKALARDLRAITKAHDSQLIVSGRLDVALAAGADGVHCGGEAPAPADLRRIAPSSLMIGASIHGDERPPEGADYVFLSPVFPTRSKPGAAPIGLDGLREGIDRSNVPVIALGGIDATNAQGCLDAGAHGVALREGLMRANDETLAALRLLLVE